MSNITTPLTLFKNVDLALGVIPLVLFTNNTFC